MDCFGWVFKIYFIYFVGWHPVILTSMKSNICSIQWKLCIKGISVVKMRVRKLGSKRDLWHVWRSCWWLCTEGIMGEGIATAATTRQIMLTRDFCECKLQKEWHAMLHWGTFCSFHFQCKVYIGYVLLALSFQDWLHLPAYVSLKKEQVSCTWN